MMLCQDQLAHEFIRMVFYNAFLALLFLLLLLLKHFSICWHMSVVRSFNTAYGCKLKTVSGNNNLHLKSNALGYCCFDLVP